MSERLVNAIARDLARAAAYPHDPDARRRGARVAWVQTHLSHVFLLRARVYKLRKSVSLGFVDFSSRARRNADCRNEVRLNRRLAPDVYLGVAPVLRKSGRFLIGPVDASGRRTDPAREHVVVMRRLPDGCDALTLLPKRRFGRAEVDAVARTLARFHESARLGRPSPWTRACWLARMRDPVLDNLRLLASDAGRLFPRATFEQAEQAARRFIAANTGVFDARRRAGRGVDGHGDVHLAHVWFEPGRAEPTLLDCIEFNPKLRRIDAAAEVAFLAMDLAYRGRARLAERFLATYAEAADDTDLYAVVDYFVSYRAAVRAKVAALAAHDAAIDAAQRKQAAASARRHLAFAARALAPRPRGGLVLVGGTVGSGKSSAAREIADALDAVLLSSDALRKRLAGMAPTDRSAAQRGLYSAAAKRAVYRGLCDRAAPVLRAGRVVVLDATWSRPADRRAAAALAKRCGVPLWVVETRVPRRVALARLARRAAEGASASDAGPERLAASEAEFARPWAGRARVVRTDRSGWRPALRRAARTWRRR